ncbi:MULTISPECIES: hypothetical protein [unclassified Rhizobacter]|uniref:hypothetical protein n=1 Tax=unclassified Rhizobacter TaxID=2640088 RepID=UPI0006F4781B|nr:MULTISPECIES: hypothetical protein [unclassified Rhizobacter]KQU81501.1 hypothetical protein ASC88_01060 [Rhizobacter sp. Root29]KQW12169.1 hypothetical protein ASC98_20510 [Rhizobacter sp. Root1238]KRB02984.1 hypothetical protein ASE08_15600 [Rhizobacter sp. Root16D2]
MEEKLKTRSRSPSPTLRDRFQQRPEQPASLGRHMVCAESAFVPDADDEALTMLQAIESIELESVVVSHNHHADHSDPRAGLDDMLDSHRTSYLSTIDQGRQTVIVQALVDRFSSLCELGDEAAANKVLSCLRSLGKYSRSGSPVDDAQALCTERHELAFSTRSKRTTEARAKLARAGFSFEVKVSGDSSMHCEPVGESRFVPGAHATLFVDYVAARHNDPMQISPSELFALAEFVLAGVESTPSHPARIYMCHELMEAAQQIPGLRDHDSYASLLGRLLQPLHKEKALNHLRAQRDQASRHRYTPRYVRATTLMKLVSPECDAYSTEAEFAILSSPNCASEQRAELIRRRMTDLEPTGRTGLGCYGASHENLLLGIMHLPEPERGAPLRQFSHKYLGGQPVSPSRCKAILAGCAVKDILKAATRELRSSNSLGLLLATAANELLANVTEGVDAYHEFVEAIGIGLAGKGSLLPEFLEALSRAAQWAGGSHLDDALAAAFAALFYTDMDADKLLKTAIPDIDLLDRQTAQLRQALLLVTVTFISTRKALARGPAQHKLNESLDIFNRLPADMGSPEMNGRKGRARQRLNALLNSNG